jgi:hypothetical protein
MSIADSIIKGTYGNNNTVGIKYSSKKTSIADSIINGSYYETLKKRKKEKEEEQKRIAEQQKLEKEQQVKKQVENVSTYGPTTQTNKVQTVTDKLKNIAPVSNEAIKSDSQIGETQKVTRSDAKAQQKATEINQDLKNGNKASAIGAILNGIPEGIKSGVAKSINALNILGARTFDEQDKKINWMQDEILKDKPNATANRLKDMPSFANRAKNKLLDKAEDLDDRTTMHSKTVSQIENSKVKTAAGVSSSIGEMVPAMISNIIAPGSGIYASAVQNAGGSAMETLNSDRNNIDKAVGTGVLKGTVSALTEKITGGNLIAKGGLDNAVGRVIKGNVKSKIGQNLLYKGYQILGEMGEEQLENEAGYVIDKVINNKDMPDLKQRWEEATETAKMTGLTTIALNLVGLGGGSIDDVELSDMSTKDKKTIKDILERAKKTGTFKEGELADLVSKTDTDNKIAPIKDLDYLESAKKNNIDTNNETVRSIARITNERGIKASYDSNAFTNTNQNALWRIKTDENGNVTREVIINPNADTNKTLQNIAIHELTHDIEGTEQYNQIKDIILKYDKTKNGFEEARKSLAETYSKMYDKNSADFNELVDNEAVADILGNKLGDQDFINNLTMQNRTLGQKIYDWVVDKFNKLNGKLGYKSEKIYWADVKNKFENAFKQEYQNTNNQTSRFSIQTTADGNKYVKVDTNQDIFEGKNINEQIKIARRYILDNFRENGINFNESNIKVTSKTANEYTHPKNKLPQSTRESKIKASTELDNLLNVSEYQYSSKDDGRHSFAKDGWDYYKTVFEVNGVKFEGLINIAKDGNKKTFYDVTKIKRISQNRSTSANAFSTSLTNSNNSIAPIKDDVNTTKYSMQESENNAWQEYLNKNYKNTGRGEAIKDVKLAPVREEHGKVQANNAVSIDNFSNTKKYIENNLNIPTKEYFENNKKLDLLTDEDYSVLNNIYEKEGKTEVLTKKEKAKILEKYASDKYKFGDSLDILAQKFVNKGHYIDKLSEDAKNPELKFIYDRNLNSFAEGQYVIGVAQTDNNGKKIGKSINDIWKPIEEAKLTKEFSDYLVNMHNANTSERGKYIIGRDIGPTESSAIALELEQKHPEFKKYAKEIKEFNHNNLLNLKDAGMITQDTIDYIETMYPNYIPISRNYDGNSYVGDNEKTGAAGPLKRLKGGSTDIQPLKDGLAGQAIRIKRLINQNKLGQELAKTLVNAKVDENIDVEVAPSLLFELDTLVDTDQKGNKYYTYFEDGKLQKLKINDKLYESLRPSERSKLESTLPVKALQKVTNLHRSLLTSDNPVFIATNFFKDIQDGAFNSKYSKKFLKNYGKALNEIVTKGKYYESYMANGGMSNTYFEYDTGVKKKGNKFVEKIRNANEVVEQLPRLSEFISTLEDGKSLNEALYNAAEITTNFKRGGDITKAINRNGANFLNASIQGLDKQFRNFSGKNGAKGYANLLVKATVMGVAPAVLNHMLLDDDDDYEKLPESTKDLYYLFKYGDGKFIRIPKGRVLSIFGSAARRTLETAEGEKDSWKGFKDTVVNQIAPNNPLEDNILAPVIAVKNNKTWYGGDLVSSRLQKELPKNQYDETTDNLSKWLGAKLNVSPKKINYLIDQYSGGIGDVLLPEVTPQAKKNVIVDKFTTDSVLKNKNVGKFYETLEKQTQIANDSFATDEDQLQLKYLNSVSKEMGDLYKEKRKIQMSNISNKEKTAKVREIQEKINTLAEKGLSNYNTGIKTKNSYKAGGENYYKDGKGEWQKLDDDELKGGLSVDTYADYKQKVYKETQSKRESGKLTKTQSLKDKDKLEILLNSNYSSKEKTAIYENYILSSTNTTYPLLKKSGIDIDEYMKYLQQDFKSEKKDNGTTSGKTVAGSAKRKTYKYVNSMNISYEQKLLLLGTQYKLNNAERTKLYNYVKTLDYSQEEMQKVFEKLQGFTVYKDGRVTW